MKIVIESSYVKAGTNIKQDDVVQILTEGEYREINSPDGKKKKVLQFDMKLANGEIKTYTMNNTTKKNLIEAFGDDSGNWMEKKLKAWVIKQSAFGKLVNVLILTPVDWTQPDSPEKTEEIEIEE